MKTTRTFIILGLIITAFFLACELPVALGAKLDLKGPVIEIISPGPRSAISAEFFLEGNVSDDSQIKRVLLIVSKGNSQLPIQWRYLKGDWSISYDSGNTWAVLEGAQWNGNANSAAWKIPIDLSKINLGGAKIDGEYLFSIQAWDISEMSDDNSIATRFLIFDTDPPKVSVAMPFLHGSSFSNYDSANGFTDSNDTELNALHTIPNSGSERFDPALIGQFLTREFTMRWQVIDDFDLHSMDIRFYNLGIEIDGNPATPLPDDYIYRYHENLPPPAPIEERNAMPNGIVKVPSLTKPSGFYEKNAELKSPITEKTTIRVVAVCYDVAGNVNQEKVLGYFVYWPLADEPWLTYPEEMKAPENYASLTAQQIDQQAFMIYPGRSIRSQAFQVHGVTKVVFFLFPYNADTKAIDSTPEDGYGNVTLNNEMRPNGSYSTVFSWNFSPPPRTGFYVIQATAYCKDEAGNDKLSDVKQALFKVQDISFPDFIQPLSPNPSDKLFMHINTTNSTITISGTVRDATEIDTLDLVWINPRSEGYAAMSQLSYFREPNYDGWLLASGKVTQKDGSGNVVLDSATNRPIIVDIGGGTPALTPGHTTPRSEGILDSNAPNKIYRLNTTQITGYGSATTPEQRVAWKDQIGFIEGMQWDNGDIDGRQRFTFTRTIHLSELELSGANSQPLKSQMFLLRAANMDGRATIITFAPQGDTVAPEILITKITITRGSTNLGEYTPGVYALIPQISANDNILIEGTWVEDSTLTLPVNQAFPQIMKNGFPIRFDISINGDTLASDVNFTKTGNNNGTWNANVTVGAQTGTTGTQTTSDSPRNHIRDSYLKDTLVVGANVRDIGGNFAEHGGSWLIQSDNLRLLRISSENPDRTYRAGETIDIFLEFSKAVQLTYGNATQGHASNPVLNLSPSGATAVYNTTRNPAGSQSTRHYFTYTVGAGHTAADLDVTNITIGNSVAWNAANYPFTWHRGTGETREEIRVTTTAGHTGGSVKTQIANAGAGEYYARRIPRTTGNGGDANDLQYTLAAGKDIVIDTTAPIVSTIAANTMQGHYRVGADIYITVTFNEEVRIGATLPRLQLGLANQVPGVTPVTYTNVDTSNAPANVTVNGRNMTFVYTVVATNNSNGRDIIVNGLQGDILDLAGNQFSGAMNGTLTGLYIDTIAPPAPTVRILSANDINSVLSNTIAGAPVQAVSGNAAVNLSNVYNSNLWLGIQPGSALTHELAVTGAIEYRISSNAEPINFTVNTTNGSYTPVQLTQTGSYSIQARQRDKAGNVSDWSTGSANISYPVNFTWNPGNFITHIDSTTANGTYTNNTARKDKINITVHFREPIAFTGSPTLTLDTGGTTELVASTTVADRPTLSTDNRSISFTYLVRDSDNTTDLDVTAITLTATDRATQAVTIPGALLALPTGTNTLASRKDIAIVTGPLSRVGLTTGNVINDNTALDVTADAGATIRAADVWTGYIDIRFNRSIKKSAAANLNVTFTQQATGYRIPAVLTETQVSRYSTARNFNSLYRRGVNGFNATTGVPDTSAKFILDYTQSAVVTPSDTGTDIQQMAWDFRQAEIVTIPISNQDITVVTTGGVTDNTLRIRLSSSNALQVLGAAYDISFPANAVVDALDNTWPSNVQAYTYTSTEVNRPYVRVDKKIDEDRITSTAGDDRTPWLQAHFDRQIQTRARLDCRTPGSVVRYALTTNNHAVTGVTAGTAGHGHGPDGASWRNDAQAVVNPTVPTLAETGTTANSATGGTYDSFAGATTGTGNVTHITVGSAATDNGETVDGFGWRVMVRSRNGANGASNSDAFQEVAYRTVLTLRVNGLGITNNLGEVIQAGDGLWIRGGDGVSLSNTPGHPLTWMDDFQQMRANGQRAGVRLMRFVQNNAAAGTNNMNNTTWRWVTWELNVETFHDIISGFARTPTSTTSVNPTTLDSLEQLWQYGPRVWRYPRGGWVASKHLYTLVPGRHRWLLLNGDNYSPGGRVNWTNQVNYRDIPAASAGITVPAAP